MPGSAATLVVEQGSMDGNAELGLAVWDGTVDDGTAVDGTLVEGVATVGLVSGTVATGTETTGEGKMDGSPADGLLTGVDGVAGGGGGMVGGHGLPGGGGGGATLPPRSFRMRLINSSNNFRSEPLISP